MAKNLTIEQMESRIVRYGALVPCRTAFIDAHTPGSDQKENFTIIGGGVSEAADQHVHIAETPGFNIGAAGQPPKCRNSLHTHRTAELFFVLSGRWRFFWGNQGDDGEVVLSEGDVINIPTGLFRGFENVGTDYAMIMAVLGGDDAGGGVIWAPQVIAEASAHGLILGENGRLYDTKKGETLPPDIQPMRALDAEQMALFPKVTAADFVPRFVARYLDMMALASGQPAAIVGAGALLDDRPGFELDMVRENSLDGAYSTDRHEILMVMRGHWRLSWSGGSVLLAQGDVCAVPPGLTRQLASAMSGEASLFRVRNTDDPAGPTHNFHTAKPSRRQPG